MSSDDEPGRRMEKVLPELVSRHVRPPASVISVTPEEGKAKLTRFQKLRYVIQIHSKS
jgi:hypothetical protein